jgi:hypothetical protein
MTGWRVGWLIGPNDVVKASTNFQSPATSNVNNVAPRATIAALNGGLDDRSGRREVGLAGTEADDRTPGGLQRLGFRVDCESRRLGDGADAAGDSGEWAARARGGRRVGHGDYGRTHAARAAPGFHVAYTVGAGPVGRQPLAAQHGGAREGQ